MPFQDKNIVLIGLSGVGKTAHGRTLACELGLGFYDTDARIESLHGRNVADLIKKEGESSFREMESSQLRFLNGIKNHVISLGAGATESYWEQEQLVASSTCIWLEASTDMIVSRLIFYANEVEKRPLLSSVFENQNFDLVDRKANKHKIFEILNLQMDIRKKLYEKAEHRFELAGYDFDSNAKKLVEYVRSGLKA